MNNETEITSQDKEIISNHKKITCDEKEVNECDEVFRKQQFTHVKWNDEEQAFKYFRKNMEDSFFKYSLPFSIALVCILKNSIFGTFLDVLNPNQNDVLNENKFSIIDYEIRHLDEVKWRRWKSKNQIFENMYGCLKYMVKKGLTINVKNLTKILKVLRMCDYYTNSIDNKLKNFKNLQILDLTGNNLRDINGSHLPKHLKLLELNNNFLTDLGNLAKNAPKHLIHLGLGRNCLNNDSSLHLFVESGNFLELCSLDLANNDIYDLNCTLKTLSSLPLLRSLLLEGNPCYLDTFYVRQVVTILTELTYLDNTEILREDRLKTSSLDILTKPKLIFQCYRLMGLPKPPSIKLGNIEHTFHIEISLPLFERLRLLPETKPLKDMIIQAGSSHINPTKKPSLKKTKEVVPPANFVRKLSRKTIVSSKTDRSPSMYDRPNEYDEQKEQTNFSFRSVRKPWSSIIEFPPMMIEVPNEDLLLLRDTLRSKVKVDIVYLLVAPPGNKKKGKIKNTTEQEDPEKETIISRYTLASFYCNLETWNWSDENLDFYWINDPTIGCVKVTGSLKDLNYSGKKSDDPDYQPQQIPKVLSCHVGFEVLRNLFCSPTEIATIYSTTFKTPRQPQLTQFTNTDENIEILTSRKTSRT